MGLGGHAYAGRNNTERLTAGLTDYQPNISNAVASRKPLLDALIKKKKRHKGGLEIGVKIRTSRAAELGQTGGTGVYQYYDTLSTSPTNTIRGMGERYSNFNQPVALSHEEGWENAGANEFDRLKEATTNAEDDLSHQINKVLWGVSGGDGNILPTSVMDIVSGTDSANLYGVAKTSTSNTWLNSQEINDCGSLETELIDAMRRGDILVRDVSPNQSDKIDLWFTDDDVFLGLQKVLTQYVMVESAKSADLGFEEIFLNKTPIRWDSLMPLDSDQDHQMIGLSLKTWEFAVRAQNDFRTTKFYDMMPEQAADVAQILLSMALVCNNPRTNVRIKGIEL